MIYHHRSMLALVVLILALAILPGCGVASRVTTFPAESAPAAVASQTIVRITQTVRRPGELELALSIANPTADSVIFASNYGAFRAATIVHDNISVVGQRTPKKSRNSKKPWLYQQNQYTVVAGEEATLRMVFRSPDLDHVDNLTLHVVASTRGVDLSWTIPIPPEPSRPATMAGNH